MRVTAPTPTMTEEQWARELLTRLGIEPSNGAMQAAVGWVHAEGGHWHNTARFNPLNTTMPEPGAGNTGTQGNIKVYTSWDQGLDATVKTLRNGLYDPILRALTKGDPRATATAIASSPWGTKGPLIYSTIAAAPKRAGGKLTGSIAGTAGPGSGTGGAADVSANDPSTALQLLLTLGLLSAGATLAVLGLSRMMGVRNPAALAAAAATRNPAAAKAATA